MVVWKWHKQAVQKEALRYHNRGAFRTQSKQAYEAARRNGWLDEVCKHMCPPQHRYSLEEILEKSNKFKHVKDFESEYPAECDRARRNGWMPHVWKHMTPAQRIYSEKDVRKVSKRCSSRMEFKERFHGVYQAAQRMNILNSVCQHMEEKAPAHVYVFEFGTEVYVGISCAPKVRWGQHRLRKDSVGKLARNVEPRLLTSSMIPRHQAESLEKFYIQEYRRQGFTVHNKNHNKG